MTACQHILNQGRFGSCVGRAAIRKLVGEAALELFVGRAHARVLCMDNHLREPVAIRVIPV